MLLNEENEYRNLWVIYTVFALLTVGYYMYYEPLKALVYAGMTLELTLQFLHFVVRYNMVAAVEEQYPTLFT